MSTWVPPTSSRTIVFPLNQHSKSFYTEFYEPDMTNDKVSLEEIDQFISEINAEYKLYKNAQEGVEGKWVCFGFLVFFIIILDIFFFLDNFVEIFVCYFTNGELIILTWFLTLFIFRFCCLKMETNPLSELKYKCQDIIDKQNETLRDRNLKWHLPDEFPTWIELTKDMKKKNNHLEIPNQAPQTTKNTMIFPHQRYKGSIFSETWRFSPDFFSPDMTDGRISCKEVQEFLSEINTCLRTALEGFSSSALNVFLCLILELFGLLFVSNHFPDLLPTFLIILIAVISVIFSFCLFGNMKEKEKRKKNILMRESCQRIVDKHNDTLQNQGLRWHLPDEFPHWIELHKVSLNQNPSSQPIEIPPENQHLVSLATNPKDVLEAGNQKFKNNVYAPLAEDDEN